jgi:hypothetical protein
MFGSTTIVALLITIRTNMKVNDKRNNKNELKWIDSQLKIELEDVKCGSKVTNHLDKNNVDPLHFHFSYDNPAYEDF